MVARRSSRVDRRRLRRVTMAPVMAMNDGIAIKSPPRRNLQLAALDSSAAVVLYFSCLKREPMARHNPRTNRKCQARSSVL